MSTPDELPEGPGSPDEQPEGPASSPHDQPQQGEGGTDRLPSPSADGDGSSFVAPKEDSTTPLEGSGVLEDIEGILSGLNEGSWLDVGLSTVAMGADVLGAAVDPLGTLIAWGAGWLIEHLNPLKKWLEEFAGDADQVKANAQTWDNVAKAMDSMAEDLEMMAKGLMADARGAAASGYSASNGDVSKSLRKVGEVGGAASKALEALAVAVEVVHDLVRDAITTIIGTLASAIIEAVATAGLAIPAIIAQVQIKVGAKAAEMGAKITGLLKSAKSLFKQLTSLKGLLELLKSLLKKGKQGLKGLKDLAKGSRRKTRELFESVTKGGKKPWTKATADSEASRLMKECDLANAEKRALLDKFDDLANQYGLGSDFRNKNGSVKVTLSNYEEFATQVDLKAKDPKLRSQILQDGQDLANARKREVSLREQLGTLGAEYSANSLNPPRHVIPGVGGAGGGRDRFDILALDEDVKNLDFIESKGIKSGKPEMGTAKDILPNGQEVKVTQGTPEYLNHIAREDKEFLQLMRDNPELWRRVKNGEVQLNNVVSVTNGKGLSSTTYESTPFTLEQRTIDHIDGQL